MKVSQILTISSTLVHDIKKERFPDEETLPLAQLAFQDMQLKLALNGNSLTKEQISSLTVPAGTTILNEIVGFPTDTVIPLSLFEKRVGESDLNYKEIVDKNWEPDITPSEDIRFYTYREDKINLVPATIEKLVRLRYIKALTKLTSVNQEIGYDNGLTFLAKQTAGYIATFLGENPTKGEYFWTMAEIDLNGIVGLDVRRRQSRPIKKRGFGIGRRRRTGWL